MFDIATLIGPSIMGLLALIAADVISGVAAALVTHTFDWRRLADFYETMVLPKLGGYLALYLATRYLPALEGTPIDEGMLAAAWAAATATIGGSLVTNLKTVFGNLWQ